MTLIEAKEALSDMVDRHDDARDIASQDRYLSTWVPLVAALVEAEKALALRDIADRLDK